MWTDGSMLHSSMFILTTQGDTDPASLIRKQVDRKDPNGSITDPLIQRRPYRGSIVYIYTEQGDHPFICTSDQCLLVKTRGSRATWMKASHVGRGAYLGTPIPEKFEGFVDCTQTVDRETLLEKQLECISSGICRAVRAHDLDEESSKGDILFDDKFCWYKVHDVETSNEPGEFMFHTSVCIANNVCCTDFS